MKFKDFWVSMLSDAEGTGISSKRFVGLVTFFVYLALAFVDTFMGRHPADVFIDGLMYIILGAFFAGTLEYFSKRQPIANTTVKGNDQVIVQVPGSSTTTTTAPVAEDEDFIVDNNTE